MDYIERLFDRINEKLAEWFMVFFTDPDYLLQTETVYTDEYSPVMSDDTNILYDEKAVEAYLKFEKFVVLAALFLKDLYGTSIERASILTSYVIEKSTSVKTPAARYKIKTNELNLVLHDKKKQAWSFLTSKKDGISDYVTARYATMRSYVMPVMGIQIKLHGHPA